MEYILSLNKPNLERKASKVVVMAPKLYVTYLCVCVPSFIFLSLFSIPTPLSYHPSIYTYSNIPTNSHILKMVYHYALILFLCSQRVYTLIHLYIIIQWIKFKSFKLFFLKNKTCSNVHRPFYQWFLNLSFHNQQTQSDIYY